MCVIFKIEKKMFKMTEVGFWYEYSCLSQQSPRPAYGNKPKMRGKGGKKYHLPFLAKPRNIINFLKGHQRQTNVLWSSRVGAAGLTGPPKQRVSVGWLIHPPGDRADPPPAREGPRAGVSRAAARREPVLWA